MALTFSSVTGIHLMTDRFGSYRCWVDLHADSETSRATPVPGRRMGRSSCMQTAPIYTWQKAMEASPTSWFQPVQILPSGRGISGGHRMEACYGFIRVIYRTRQAGCDRFQRMG